MAFILELTMVAPIALILGCLEVGLITRGFTPGEKCSRTCEIGSSGSYVFIQCQIRSPLAVYNR